MKKLIDEMLYNNNNYNYIYNYHRFYNLIYIILSNITLKISSYFLRSVITMYCKKNLLKIFGPLIFYINSNTTLNKSIIIKFYIKKYYYWRKTDEKKVILKINTEQNCKAAAKYLG